MGKSNRKNRTKKQQKFYRHLARQHKKASPDTRRVVLKEVQDYAELAKKSTPANDEIHFTISEESKDNAIPSDDAISLMASDNDFH